MAVAAAVMLFWNIRVKKRTAEDLLVNRLAREAAGASLETPAQADGAPAPSPDLEGPEDAAPGEDAAEGAGGPEEEKR